MKTGKSAQRQKFEEDALPHLEALWRTARWLTIRSNHAEDLVLKAMTQAYQIWHVADNMISGKARLFRTLIRECAAADHAECNPHRFLPDRDKTAPDNGNGDRPTAVASIDPGGLLLLTGVSELSFKGAVARLSVQSRLIVILRLCERFSYAEIAYMTDLPRDSVKSIFVGLRRMIPQNLVQHTEHFVTTAAGRTTLPMYGISAEDGQYQG